jgi:hypothetical protein
MRYHVFVALLAVAVVLDLGLLAIALANPNARVFEPHTALAANAPAQPSPTATATSTPPAPSPTVTSTSTSTPLPPSPTASPIATSMPSPTASPTALPTSTPTPTPRLLADKSVSFTPRDKAVRANIRLALAHYSGALTRVVLAPGEVFSFNAALGLRPQRLPWKYVRVKPSATPAEEGAPEVAAQLIQGGGVCDLASRYVMAARPLLPARAFRFVNHVRSNGIHLSGVPDRDAVSIWAVGGGRGEQDLKITNLSSGWLEWVVVREGEKLTVTARLWDSAPPGW